MIAHSRRRRDIPAGLLSKRNIKEFAMALKRGLRDKDNSLCRAYIRHLIDHVIVGEKEIRIEGSHAALLSMASQADALKNRQVPSSIEDWRWGQSRANLSLLNSLLNRENTGNICGIR